MYVFLHCYFQILNQITGAGLGAAEKARLVSVLMLHLGRLAIAQVAGDKGRRGWI